MVKKILLVIAILSTFQLSANEEISPSEKCELTYTACLDKCDASEDPNKEACYDKCDQVYSKCLEDLQTKE